VHGADDSAMLFRDTTLLLMMFLRKSHVSCLLTRLHLMSKVSMPVSIATIVSVCLVMTFAGCSKPPSEAERPPGPSYGEGSYEVILFTDYFCPPCQALEPELDPVLNDLIEKGGVKITFVDAPVHKLTPMYSKYFLYAAKANSGFRDILHTRKALFSIAKSNVVSTEEGLASELKAQRIVLQPYDPSNVYSEWNEMMKKHDIRSTPICVVKYPDADIRRYIGPEEIKRGLSLLLSAQKP
jgi:thiol-disulfide isomerase/thioredoxin